MWSLMTKGPSPSLRDMLQARNESGVSVQTALGENITDLGIVVGKVGHFRILSRRTDEGVAPGRQRLLKLAIQLLGQYPAPIKEFISVPLVEAASRQGRFPRHDNASSSNSKHSNPRDFAASNSGSKIGSGSFASSGFGERGGS